MSNGHVYAGHLRICVRSSRLSSSGEVAFVPPEDHMCALRCRVLRLFSLSVPDALVQPVLFDSRSSSHPDSPSSCSTSGATVSVRLARL